MKINNLISRPIQYSDNFGNDGGDSSFAQSLQFGFDLNQHEISYEDARGSVNNYLQYVQYEIAGGATVSGKVHFSFIDIAAFKQAIPADTNRRNGVRITLGWNPDERRLQYYFSWVAFDQLPVNNRLSFTPADNEPDNNNLSYLRAVPVFMLEPSGTLSRVYPETADWIRMESFWSKYKESIQIFDPQTGRYSAYNRMGFTRSIIIPVQVLYNLINSDPTQSQLKIVSCLHTNNTPFQHSVVFSNSDLDVLKIQNALPVDSMSALQSLLPETFQEQFDLFSQGNANALSQEAVLYLELALNPQSRNAYGRAANYAQICPTKCAQLTGAFNAVTRVFRLA